MHISIDAAQGVMPLIGYSYGAKNHKRVYQVCCLSFLTLLVFSYDKGKVYAQARAVTADQLREESYADKQ